MEEAGERPVKRLQNEEEIGAHENSVDGQLFPECLSEERSLFVRMRQRRAPHGV